MKLSKFMTWQRKLLLISWYKVYWMISSPPDTFLLMGDMLCTNKFDDTEEARKTLINILGLQQYNLVLASCYLQ